MLAQQTTAVGQDSTDPVPDSAKAGSCSTGFGSSTSTAPRYSIEATQDVTASGSSSTDPTHDITAVALNTTAFASYTATPGSDSTASASDSMTALSFSPAIGRKLP